ncbi:unannotated protein [freshwater metagenome]|uniref:Unannotated protein n=1 Tax=freshwater metagenome TaxID=449393 RepID=A0A6J6VT21_9ZZZZ
MNSPSLNCVSFAQSSGPSTPPSSMSRCTTALARTSLLLQVPMARCALLTTRLETSMRVWTSCATWSVFSSRIRRSISPLPMHLKTWQRPMTRSICVSRFRGLHQRPTEVCLLSAATQRVRSRPELMCWWLVAARAKRAVTATSQRTRTASRPTTLMWWRQILQELVFLDPTHGSP